MKTATRLSLAAILLSSTLAQQQYQIDPNSVLIATRENWCTQQKAACPLICLQSNPATSPRQNDCNATLLTYACVCADGTSPNVTEYSQTLPYNICQAWGIQCVANCGSDSTCAYNCNAYHPCGAQNPVRVNASTFTSSMASTASAGASESGSASGSASSGSVSASTTSAFTGFADGGSPTGQPTGASGTSGAVAVWALSAGQTFGSLAVAGALFGGFAVLL